MSWNWFIVIQRPEGVERLHIENIAVIALVEPTKIAAAIWVLSEVEVDEVEEDVEFVVSSSVSVSGGGVVSSSHVVESIF